MKKLIRDFSELQGETVKTAGVIGPSYRPHLKIETESGLILLFVADGDDFHQCIYIVKEDELNLTEKVSLGLITEDQKQNIEAERQEKKDKRDRARMEDEYERLKRVLGYE